MRKVKNPRNEKVFVNRVSIGQGSSMRNIERTLTTLSKKTNNSI